MNRRSTSLQKRHSSTKARQHSLGAGRTSRIRTPTAPRTARRNRPIRQPGRGRRCRRTAPRGAVRAVRSVWGAATAPWSTRGCTRTRSPAGRSSKARGRQASTLVVRMSVRSTDARADSRAGSHKVDMSDPVAYTDGDRDGDDPRRQIATFDVAGCGGPSVRPRVSVL